LCTVTLLLTKSPLPFCALFGFVTKSTSVCLICTITTKLKWPAYIGIGFSSIGADATLQKTAGCAHWTFELNVGLRCSRALRPRKPTSSASDSFRVSGTEKLKNWTGVGNGRFGEHDGNLWLTMRDRSRCTTDASFCTCSPPSSWLSNASRAPSSKTVSSVSAHNNTLQVVCWDTSTPRQSPAHQRIQTRYLKNPAPEVVLF